ncbi:transposase [Rhizobium laguerreae]|nr:transposase [Rhizobium laguerreae]
MDCDALRDDQWERIKDCVPGGTKGKRRPRTNNRLFLDALLWVARSGGRWRDLPERLGGHCKLNAAKTRSGSEALVHSAWRDLAHACMSVACNSRWWVDGIPWRGTLKRLAIGSCTETKR